MKNLVLPKGYKSTLDIVATQRAIKGIKDVFQTNLARTLNLKRVSAPLFVSENSGLNDNLTGIETPVSFEMTEHEDLGKVEIVQSLAKWKRLALHRYGFKPGVGLYTDMDAIRPHEVTGNMHSIYVDQWDWELVMAEDERNMDFLIDVVERIFDVFKRTEEYMNYHYAERYEKLLPEKIFFISAQELEDLWPEATPKEREYNIVKEKKAVFITGIGGTLKSGKAHDGRAPDYDDWDLNGDIVVWHEVLNRPMELSSMGIRVDGETLKKQLKIRDAEDRLNFNFHKQLAAGELPQTVGGGIGQSRMCMFFMQKAHIGEVQASVWPDEMHEICENHGILLL